MMTDPTTIGVALAIVAEMRWAIARLDRRVANLEDTKADKPASRKGHAIARVGLWFVAAGLLLTAGCTQEQIARAEAAADRAEVVLKQAGALVAVAQSAVAAAQEAAAHQAPGAADALAKAQASLDMAQAAIPGLQATAAGARAAAEAAQAASAAGSSWWNTAAAIIAALVPAAGAVVVSVQRTVAVSRALRQTVAGLDDARAQLGEDQWKAAVAPYLAAAQDDSVKSTVRRIQAA
jgi:hypothetical protein